MSGVYRDLAAAMAAIGDGRDEAARRALGRTLAAAKSAKCKGYKWQKPPFPHHWFNLVCAVEGLLKSSLDHPMRAPLAAYVGAAGKMILDKQFGGASDPKQAEIFGGVKVPEADPAPIRQYKED